MEGAVAPSYLDLLTQPEPKKSRRSELLQLALQLMAMSMQDEMNDEGFAEKDGTGPEMYVAPRYSPSP